MKKKLAEEEEGDRGDADANIRGIEEDSKEHAPQDDTHTRCDQRRECKGNVGDGLFRWGVREHGEDVDGEAVGVCITI